LLLSTDGTLKISDFGVSQEFNIYERGAMFTDLFAGTHQFLAPEVLESSQLFDGAKVDVWACGVTLYNMISGKLPFDSEDEGNYLELYDRIMKSEIIMPKEITPEIEDLFHLIFIKNPAKRASVSQVLNHQWVLTIFHRPLKLPHLLLFKKMDCENRQSLSDLAPVCETTMIPYLDELFEKELVKNLADQGSLKKVVNLSSIEIDASESTSSLKSRPKLINWLKKKIGT
jgi:serine/threonine protein kinase